MSASTSTSLSNTVPYADGESPSVCTWCNRSKPTPPSLKHQWSGPLHPSPAALRSCYQTMGGHTQTGTPEGWSMVLPMGAGRSPGIMPFSGVENQSFPSTPGSATDLSPSTYSEGQGYFDFIPIRNENSAPISPGSLSVPGSDNDPGEIAGTSPTSRTQSQRDSKARCLKKLDNAMERLISILPNEMQLSCKRGRANGLKLVEEYITRIIAENNQLRAECKTSSTEKDHAVNEGQKLREELAKLRHALQNNYR